MDVGYIALAAVLGTLLGVVITSAFNSINSLSAQRSEERKHLRDLVFRLGFEYYQQQVDFAKYNNEKHGVPASIPPVETYIFHVMKLTEMLDEKEAISLETIEPKLRELFTFSAKLNEVT